eukprot:NODE_885_length_3319_cov_0.856832.p2 type:complete len:131 gc:universal NODE_885_length_3319_cov_0.856832:2344-2736(+)
MFIFATLSLADVVSDFKNACIATCGAGDLTCLANCDNYAADRQAISTNTTSMLFLTDCLKNCKPQDENCRNTCITMDQTYRYQNLPNVSWTNNLPNTPEKKSNTTHTDSIDSAQTISLSAGLIALSILFQ